MRKVAPGSTTPEQCRCSGRPGRQVARLTKFELPVDIFVGQHDQTAGPTLSRAYFDVIDAPVKGFYMFEYSAHSPLFEESERATKVLLQDVLHGMNALADATGRAGRETGSLE